MTLTPPQIGDLAARSPARRLLAEKSKPTRKAARGSVAGTTGKKSMEESNAVGVNAARNNVLNPLRIFGRGHWRRRGGKRGNASGPAFLCLPQAVTLHAGLDFGQPLVLRRRSHRLLEGQNPFVRLGQHEEFAAGEVVQFPLPFLKAYARPLCLAWNPRLTGARPVVERAIKALDQICGGLDRRSIPTR